MIVEKISEQVAKEFIKQHNFNLFLNSGQEGTKYEFTYRGDQYSWYGIFDKESLVAIQVIKILEDNKIHLVALQKISTTQHGVFEAVLDYFKNYTLLLEAYYPGLQKMYENLGFTKVKGYYYKYIRTNKI